MGQDLASGCGGSSFSLHNARDSCGCFFAAESCPSGISVGAIVAVYAAVKLQLLLNKCHITCL